MLFSDTGVQLRVFVQHLARAEAFLTGAGWVVPSVRLLQNL